MEKLISSKSRLQFVPESYILPPDSRPGRIEFPLCETIPVVDLRAELGFDRAQLAKQIIQASQEFGSFQLINHGVSKKLMNDVLDVASEFFELPAEDRACFYSDDPNRSCRLRTSINYDREEVHYWRDNLRHPCHPPEECMQLWPEKPAYYREVIGCYSAQIRKLSFWLLDLIAEGLGLESGYFRGELSQAQFISVNHYPPCPDPSLTLGLPKHCDPNVITLLLQGEAQGLQVLEDGQWLAVEPLPNALFVNIGYMLQIMSNGKLSSAEHRVMTNKNVARTTVTSFIYPSSNCRIGPVKTLLSDCIPPLYRDFVFKDFLSNYASDTPVGVPTIDRYKVQY